MKPLIIGLILLTSLVAHAEPSEKFSINESDTKEKYANNSDFESIYCLPGSTSYEFKVAPASVYGIKTDDLDIVEGKICFLAIRDSRLITLVVKGKNSFDKFINRIIKADYVKDLDCGDTADIQNSRFLYCIKDTGKTIRRVSLIYHSKADTAEFTIQNLN